ncbi:MAG: hypothetical protein ACRBFS_19490 [Aureispira sp.]
MRLDVLIDYISPLVSSVVWVDRYAGLVQKLEKRTSDNKSTVTYPVACNVINANCGTKPPFEALVPDDRASSIVYWEELTSMTTSPLLDSKSGANWNGWVRSKGRARVVVWANLKKLGISECTLPPSSYLELQRTLTIETNIALPVDVNGVAQNGSLKVFPFRVAPKDVNEVFGKYTYKKNVNYYLKPYDYFALDVEFVIDYCYKREVRFIPSPPINC